MPPRRIAAPWAVSLGALAAYAALAVAVFASAWVDPRGRWIGDAKDPRLFIWYLGYVPAHLPSLFAEHLNAPYGVNLMWNTSVIAPSVLLWPLTAFAGPVVAFDALITLGVAGSAWAAFQAAGVFLEGRWARFLAGLLYGFSPAVMAQATRHAHVALAIFPPLALLLGYEVLVRRRRHPALAGALAGGLAALQLLTSEEMLALSAIAGAIGLAAAMWGGWRPPVKPLMVASAAAVAAFVVVAGYPLGYQFLGPQRVAGSLQPPDRYVNDLLAFVVPNFNALQSGATRTLLGRFTGNPSEENAFVGIPLLLAFALAMASARGMRMVRPLGAVAVVLAVLSLGPHLHVAGFTTAIPMPWWILGRLPLLESADADRLMLIGYLPFAVVVAHWTRRQWACGGPPRLLAAGLVGLGLVAYAPVVPFPSTAAEAPVFFRPGGAVTRIAPGSTVLVTPFSSKESTDAMYWQAVAGYRFRMPEGDAFSPGPTLGPRPSPLRSTLEALDEGVAVNPSDSDLAAARALLRNLGVTVVVAGPSKGRAAILDYLTRALGSPPESVDGVAVWWDCCPSLNAAKPANTTTSDG